MAAALTSGCSRCEPERPYTPFTIAPAVSSTPPASEPAPAVATPAMFAGRKAELAPPAATRWQLGERTLDAPPGRLFERAVRADFDADAKEDSVVWTVPATSEPAVPGELWFYPAAGQPRRIAPLSAFVPTGPSCKLATVLSQTGERSVTLDTSAACELRVVARSPVRAISVYTPAAEEPHVITLRVAEPAPGELLELLVDSSDRDGDGRDDVSVSVTVQAESSQRPATARLAWLDRAAGSSRESSEPARSLGALASNEAVRAKGKNTSRSVPDGIGNLRRIYATLCAESATARVFDQDGAALACGNLQAFVDKLSLAETVAALTQKDLVEAAGVLTRDGWYRTKISEAQKKTLQAELEKAITIVNLAPAISLEPRPVPQITETRFSPLNFEPQGTLLVQTPRGLVRIARDGASTEELSGTGSGTASWPLEVLSEDGVRWTGLTYACDRSEVLLSFARAGAAPEAVPTRLLAPRPGACRGGNVPPVPAASPLSFRKAGLEAIVAGKPLGPKTSLGEAALRPHVPGSARSPDGRQLVVPTSLGLLVTSGDHGEFWRPADWNTPAHRSSGCVIANEARAVACIVDDRVRLVLRP